MNTMKAKAKVKNHEARNHQGIVLERFKHLPKGGKMGDLPLHLQHDSFIRRGSKKTGGPNMRLYRLEMDIPALTVTAYIFNKFVHPKEDRYITPREAACLQDFPLDWDFKGTKGQVHKQIGNAVPVLLAKAIAESVARFLKRQAISGEMTIASYFTGAGGLDLGFECSKSNGIFFETKFSTDIEEWAEQTINANRPEWNFLRKDIRKLQPEEVLNIAKRPIDIIIGGPPCQPFSVAGKQKAIDDPLGRLYSDFIRQIQTLQPKAVVMENVYGLAQVKSANMIDLIYQSYEKIGYEVKHQEVLAADYGTPQKRRRLIFVAAKNLDGYEFPDPTHSATSNLLNLSPHKGAGQAICELPPPTLIA